MEAVLGLGVEHVSSMVPLPPGPKATVLTILHKVSMKLNSKPVRICSCPKRVAQV